MATIAKWLMGATGALSLPRLASLCAIVAAVAFGGGAWAGARLASSLHEAANARATNREQGQENEKQDKVHAAARKRVAQRTADRATRDAIARDVDDYLRRSPDADRAVLDADGVRIWNCLAVGQACGGGTEPAAALPGVASAIDRGAVRDQGADAEMP